MECLLEELEMQPLSWEDVVDPDPVEHLERSAPLELELESRGRGRALGHWEEGKRNAKRKTMIVDGMVLEDLIGSTMMHLMVLLMQEKKVESLVSVVAKVENRSTMMMNGHRHVLLKIPEVEEEVGEVSLEHSANLLAPCML